jgi:hypothetical protein
MSEPKTNHLKDAVHVEVRLRVAWKCVNEALTIARRHKAQWSTLDHELDQTLTTITRHLGRVQIIQCQRPTQEDER